MFIIEDNILLHLGGPSDRTGSLENFFPGMQDRSNNLSNMLQCMYFSSHFSSIFDIFINDHEYANEIIFK